MTCNINGGNQVLSTLELGQEVKVFGQGILNMTGYWLDEDLNRKMILVFSRSELGTVGGMVAVDF
jgi:hypothetical protein